MLLTADWGSSTLHFSHLLVYLTRIFLQRSGGLGDYIMASALEKLEPSYTGQP